MSTENKTPSGERQEPFDPAETQLDIDTSAIAELQREVVRLRESEARALDFCIGLSGKTPEDIKETYAALATAQERIAELEKVLIQEIKARDAAIAEVVELKGERDIVAKSAIAEVTASESVNDMLARRNVELITQLATAERQGAAMREALEKARDVMKLMHRASLENGNTRESADLCRTTYQAYRNALTVLEAELKKP